MSRRDGLLLLVLSAIWGSSFLFIKVAVEHVEPSVVVCGRLLVGGLLLLPLLARAQGLRALGPALPALLALGVLNNAVPFWLLGLAEKRLDSGLTAVIQAAAPILTVALAIRFDPSQTVRGLRLAGIGLGFLGVALLVGAQPGGDVLSALAVLLTALCYAASVLIAGRTMRTFSPVPVSVGQIMFGLVAMAPLALAQLPDERPPAAAVWAIVALGALGTGIAYLLYFALIRSAGASRTILVTYLVPVFALVYGAVFLEEKVTGAALLGLLLILGGTTLATGLAGRRRRLARAAAS